MNRRHVVVDVETTGLDPLRGARGIEIGAIAIENGCPAREFHSLINPEKRISIRARKVHGITDEMIQDAPKPDEVIPGFRNFIGSSVLIAHNARFDCRFLRYEFGRLGLAFDNRHVCTLKLSRKLCPRLSNHKLETVYRYLFGNLPDKANMHRALDDARLVAKVWMEVLNLKSEISNRFPEEIS